MTGRTAAEIYFNPDDLHIYIGEVEGGEGLWGLAICRGPRLEQHPYKPLVTSNETSRFTKESALEAIESNLRAASKFGDTIFTDPGQNLLRSLAANGHTSKESYLKKNAPVLEMSDIDKIMEELRTETGKTPHQSSTNTWKIWEERYPAKSAA